MPPPAPPAALQQPPPAQEAAGFGLGFGVAPDAEADDEPDYNVQGEESPMSDFMRVVVPTDDDLLEFEEEDEAAFLVAGAIEAAVVQECGDEQEASSSFKQEGRSRADGPSRWLKAESGSSNDPPAPAEAALATRGDGGRRHQKKAREDKDPEEFECVGSPVSSLASVLAWFSPEPPLLSPTHVGIAASLSGVVAFNSCAPSQ